MVTHASDGSAASPPDDASDAATAGDPGTAETLQPGETAEAGQARDATRVVVPDTSRPPRTLVVEALGGGGRRVALLEGGRVVEIEVDRPEPGGAASGDTPRSGKTTPSLVGAVFKGRVARVVPSMQAAFVELGLPKASSPRNGSIAARTSGRTAVVAAQSR